MLPEELGAAMNAHGIALRADEARRVFAHAVGRGRSVESLPRLRASVREAVAEATSAPRLEVVERATDDDGFVKWLLRSPDGAISEAVRIPLEREGRYSICLSTQVGCAMGCDFCATGRLGLTRNLAAWEMVAAFAEVRRATTEGRITSAVFMGQGEPFHNYDAVIQAARILSHPNGGAIAQKAITISTVGLVPQIRRYTAEGHRYRLIVSIHSADPDKRRRLLPVAGRHDLDDLLAAVAAHARATGQPVPLAWTLMGGVNDGIDEVAALKRRIGDLPVIVNLIDVNDARPDGYRRASPEALEAFRDALAQAGLPMRRRYSGGRERHAACGMLAARRGASARGGGSVAGGEHLHLGDVDLVEAPAAAADQVVDREVIPL